MSNLETHLLICNEKLNSENLSNLIKLITHEKLGLYHLEKLCKDNTEKFQSNKELNSILSNIIYYHSEEEILQFLPTIKTLNYRFDKMYLHNAFLTKKKDVIQYLLKNGCPLRPFHLQSTIKSDNVEYVKIVLKKITNDQSFGERIQKSLPEWLAESTSEEIYKLCIPHCSLPSLNTLTNIAIHKNYYLLYMFLELCGLQLSSNYSSKILDILNANLLSVSLLSDKDKDKDKYKYGIHNDIERIQSSEKSEWYAKCIKWCKMDHAERYFYYINQRNNEIDKLLSPYICKDVVKYLCKFI